MSKSVYIKWSYNPEYAIARVLPDPRIAIARHLQWTRSSTGETFYTLPEPDNYNRAIFVKQPIECPFIRDQVIYKSTVYRGWFCVYYVPKEQIEEFETWAGNRALALWRHTKPPSLKQEKLLLNRSDFYKELTVNERLLTMGYYKKLAVKYFEGDTKIVKSLIGEARANLTDFIPKDEIQA